MNEVYRWNLLSVMPAVAMFAGVTVLGLADHATSRETLTPEHVRDALGAAGFNPGSMRDGYVLRSVRVEAGEHHGEFIVRIKIEPTGQP